MDESPEWGEEVNPIPPPPSKVGGGSNEQLALAACVTVSCQSFI